MRYRSTKTYGHEVGLSCCFRQWRAQSHCAQLHGYALAVSLEFDAFDLDATNWVVDFGGLKDIKAWLVDMFDHTLLVAKDDPELATLAALGERGLAKLWAVEATGCEAFAALIWSHVTHWLEDRGHSPRVKLVSVEVREHGANSAKVVR